MKLYIQVFILVKLFDHLKHDQKNIRGTLNLLVIAQLTKEDLNKKSALAKHVCLNWQQIDWESSAILAIESDH